MSSCTRALILSAVVALLVSPLAQAQGKGKGGGGGGMTLGDLNCGVDEIAKFNGTEWVCAPDETGTESLGFNYVIVDADTGLQVGIDGGPHAGFDPTAREVIYKVDMADGTTEAWVEVLQPSPLPEVATDTNLEVLYHTEFTGTYSCTDLSAVGWYSRWAKYVAERDEWQGILAIPEQEFTQTVTRQFGSTPFGDVVLAEIREEKSVSWAGNYTGIPCLDPARYDPTTGQSGCPPETVRVQCAITVVASAWDQGGTAENWALRVPPNADFSVVAPYASYFGIEAQSIEDANAALALCNAATGDRCIIQNVGSNRVIHAYTTQALTPHAVSYSATESVVDVSTIGQVPGNRGEPRRFKGEFR